MLRKVLSLGALVVVALSFGIGNAAAKPSNPPKVNFAPAGMSDGRFANWIGEAFSGCRD
jgi:hypothetical protein